MYQFFVEPSQVEESGIRITGSDVNHIKNVLRMKPGEEITVITGGEGKEYRCRIEKIAAQEVICGVLSESRASRELPAEIYLFQGLPKADKMELIIQKAVELGAYEIIPVACRRCVVKLDEKKRGSKTARWQGIAEAAAKQSKRHVIPRIREVMGFSEALSYAQDMDLKLIPYELSEDMEKTKQVLQSVSEGQKIAVFIGPEGGFEEAEVRKAKEGGAVAITLGKRVLRTETAGFTVLSWLMYLLEK